MIFENKDALAEILAHAAAADRTVIEFRSSGEGAEREVQALDITSHVEELESRENRSDE
ncbi:hypothetical protein M1M38_gp054 [Halorubrum tailed virus 27]|uniref:Uncharacterized protein n=1 Tax=Halorubrum tailed virus 27 TaxID=2878008 RepID=A0AAE8XYZ8_9CAUD|nr:hypothetical protein M1M38_gp054 [Halorubrum tailed virus 27]UBF22747.1 hypothetical protein HRTV-27_gp54 [Halorubrum tailed virus 27]